MHITIIFYQYFGIELFAPNNTVIKVSLYSRKTKMPIRTDTCNEKGNDETR